MGEFEAAVVAWREAPFPSGSDLDELDELHADLVLADTWVAESVIPFVERGVHDPARVAVIDNLRKLDERAIRLMKSCGLEHQRQADAYRRYIELLRRVYQGFLEQRSPTPRAEDAS
jgi:hypothetical protein